MNRRTGLIGLFVGLVLLIGAWMLLSVEEAPKKKVASAPPKTPIIREGKVEASRLKALPLNERPEMSLQSLAARQGRLQAVAPDRGEARPGARPPGVFALDQQGVAAAVEGRKKDLEACYETALFHTPELAGTLTLVLQVEPVDGSPFGKITSVDTESSLDATVFEGCVATVFEELMFDTQEPTTLRYPVTFEPPDEN